MRGAGVRYPLSSKKTFLYALLFLISYLKINAMVIKALIPAYSTLSGKNFRRNLPHAHTFLPSPTNFMKTKAIFYIFDNRKFNDRKGQFKSKKPGFLTVNY